MEHPNEVVKGWSRPGWFAYREHRPRVDRLDQVVLQNISPHKLYRRSFVHEQDVWFPEGKVRMEDFSYNGLAWARTDAIGVLADYPCYQWSVHHENSHKASYDYDVYWASFEESLAPILALEEGDKRDQLLIRWYRSRILQRVQTFNVFPTEHVDRLLASWVTLMPLFPPHLDRQLNAANRARSALLRAGDRAGMLELAELDMGHRFDRVASRVSWEGDRLKVDLSATVVDREGRPFPLQVVDGRVRRRVPEGLDAVSPDVWDLTADLDSAFVELVVRSRETAVDWILPATSRVWAEPGADGLHLTMSGEIPPFTAAQGCPLGSEVWDVFFRLCGVGYTPTRRLFLDPDLRSQGALINGRTAVAYRTRAGNLALDLSGQMRPLPGTAATRHTDLTVEPGHSSIALPGVHVVGRTDLPATLHVGRTSHPARLVGRDGKATLEVDHEVAGRGDVRVTVHGKIGSPLFRLGRLPRLAAALRLDRARGVAGRLARRLAPRLAPRLARRLRG